MQKGHKKTVPIGSRRRPDRYIIGVTISGTGNPQGSAYKFPVAYLVFLHLGQAFRMAFSNKNYEL